jgi:hypothetical protein
MALPSRGMPPIAAELIRAARRRSWPIWTAVAFAILGMATTLGLAATAATARGVYWSELQVRFMSPHSAANQNVLQISPSSLVMAAGAVEKMVIDTSAPRVIDPANTLASQGVKHGFGVSLPNTGGQWASNFTDPWLEVQAVGSSPAEVVAATRTLVARIDAALATLQRRAHVDRYNLISTQLSPLSGPAVYYQAGSRSRAAVAALVLGTGITSIVVVLLLRYARRRPLPGIGVPPATPAVRVPAVG